MKLGRGLFVVWLAALAACSGASPAPIIAVAPQCAGKVEPPAGLEEIADDALLKDASGEPGKGGICGGRAYRVVNAMTVYRVWERKKPGSKLGRWWSFAKPAMTLPEFRAAYDVCEEWGERDMLVECHLVPGAHVVIGAGQSVDCAKAQKRLPGSPTLQLFVPNDTRDAENPKLFVTDCGGDQAWP